MSKWVKANLSDVTDITMGQSPDSASYNEVGFGYPFLQGCADFGKRYPKARIFCSDAKKIGRKDSVLISVRAPVGELNLADKDYCVGRGVSAIYPRKVNRDFLFNSLLLNKRLFYRVSQGSTFEAINSNDLNSFSIDYPDDMASQNKIARILNTIDVVIEQTELTIEKLKSIKQGMMHDLFTRGIDVRSGELRLPFSEAPELYKQTELGWIPKEWEVLTIKSSKVEIIDGDRGENYPKQDDFKDEGFCLFLNAGNVTSQGFCFRNNSFITKQKELLLGTGRLERGDIVITSRGTVGNMAYFDENIRYDLIRINSGMFILRNGEINLLSEFLFYSFKEKYFINGYAGLGSGSAQPQLPIRDFNKFLFPKPSVPEQKFILSLSRSLCVRIENEESVLRKYMALKQGLMQDLLTGKVEVVPDPQDKGVN